VATIGDATHNGNYYSLVVTYLAYNFVRVEPRGFVVRSLILVYPTLVTVLEETGTGSSMLVVGKLGSLNYQLKSPINNIGSVELRISVNKDMHSE
jgi:hypothetical protein